jgi:hypothetical protein
MSLVVPGCNRRPFGEAPCVAPQDCTACETCVNDTCVPRTTEDDVVPTCDAPVSCDGLPTTVVEAGTLTGLGAVQLPVVLFDGARYALSWYAVPDGAFFAFADRDGTLDPASVVNVAAYGLFPRVAYSGDRYAVAYVRDVDLTDEVRDLRIQILDAEGRPEGIEIVLVAAAYPEDPAIAYDRQADAWLLVWEDHQLEGVFFSRVRDDGTASAPIRLSAPGRIAQLGGGGTPLVVVGGETFAVFSEGAYPGHVRLARIAADGTVAGISDLETDQPYRAALSRDASGFAVVWENLDGETWSAELARADASGTFVPGSHLSMATPGEQHSNAQVVWTGESYTVLWTRNVDAELDLWRAVVLADGTLARREPVSGGPGRQWFPYLIWDGCRHVLSYAVDDGITQDEGRLMFIP